MTEIARGETLPDQPTDTPPSRGLGPWMSMAMVIGAMIGSGIYVLPSLLAPYGPNVAFGWMLSILGTMAIALSIARLAARIPGGPTAYIRQAFGELPAFITMWSYMISVWVAIPVVSLACAGALSYPFPQIATTNAMLVTAGTVVLILTAINLAGIRAAGSVQVITTLIKLIPLVTVIALVFGRVATATPLEAPADMALSFNGILGVAALTLFALTGFEVGAITAPVTDDAERNVPRAQVLGVGFTGLIYLLATLAVLAVLPLEIAANSKTPFADAIGPVLGRAAGTVIALIAAISAFGACNALFLGVAEVTRSLAKQGDLPARLGATRRDGVPFAALLLAAALSLLLLYFSAAPSFLTIYTFLGLVSAIASLALYAMCSAAVIKLGIAGGSIAITIAVLAVIYAIAMFFGAGWEATKWGLIFMLTGLPVRILSRWWNARSTSPQAASDPAAPRESTP